MKTRITHAFSSILLLALLCVGLVLPLLNVVPSVQAADSTILTPKWNVTGQPEGESGVLIADINKDGREEVIRAAAGWIRVFDGVTGAVLWGRPDAALSTMAKPQMADLNNDGFLEIIVNIARGVMAYRFPNGVIANGAVYWRRNDLSGYANHWSSPVVGIIDGGVYPTVFVGGEDAESGNLSGRVTALKYDGTVLRQAFTWRPCFGGLSLADTDSDGHFELFQGDRSNSYGDGGYGRGIRCFWAENLSVKWERPEILCSSHCPLLVDVNKDGILEVIAGQTGNTCVLNSIDGSFIRPQVRDTDSFPIHFQPSAYDIDLDGNPELLMADGHDNTADDVIVWDLTTWHLDANISRTVVGKCYYGPKAADVTGDGVMELIACSYGSVFVIDHANFTVLDRETLQGDYYSMRLTYAVVNDIDGDGLAELVVSSFGGNIWAFDTHAPKSNPRARSEVQHYSEMRLGAAEYVPPPGSTANPLILNASPSDKSSNVPVTLSALKFTLKDYQNNVMSYNVVTSPNIGSWSGNNVASGTTISLGPLSLSYSTTYTWRVNVTDSGGHLTSRPFSFRTEFAPVSNVAPIQGDPLLVSSSNPPAGGDTLTCSNQSTSDANGNPVTNIYNWYRNDVSLATLIMPFDIRNEVTAKDYSGYNNNGAVNGATWTSAGMVGGCYDFPSGGNIVVPYSTSLDGNGTWSEITVEHWIYFTVDQDGTRTVEKTWSYEIGFQQGSTNRLYAAIWTRSDPFNGYRATSTYTLSKNTWYHVVMTYKDGVGLFLYVNGVLRASRTDRVGLIQSCAALGPFVGPNTPEPLYIGWFNSFRGKIDEVRIYPKALSQQQINQRYTETRYGLSTSSVMTGSETLGGTWKCQVTPNDGYADGTAKTATVFLGNAPPTFAGVYITPDPAFDSSTLTAHPYGWFDADGDAESYVYQWQILSGGTWQDLVGRTSATLGSSYSGPGDYVRIRVTPYDGEDYGTARYQTKWIASFSSLTDPLLLSSLGTNTTDEDLTCYNQTSTATTNIYNWYVNGVPLANLLMPFNNNSASTAADYSGYSNNGAVTGATWTSSGIEGGAYNFNGDDVITVADSASLSGSWSEITVEYWAYPSVDQRGARILNKNGGAAGTSGKYMTGINTDANGPANVIFFGVTVGGSYQETYSNTATAIPTGSWSHIVGTYRSGEGIKLYINGVLKSSADGITGNIDASVGEPLFIGYSSGTPGTANRYFNGTLDEMRIYSRALSPEQAFQRYLESKDNLFTSSTILSQETEAGETWRCLVTPSRSAGDLTSRYSNSLTILGGAPVQWKLTVNSGHDTPNPTVGDHFYSDASSVTCNVTSPVTEGNTVWTCTGWTGTGSVPASGSGSSVTFSITQNSTITWNWQGTPVEWTLTVASAQDSPSPSVGNHLYSDGSSVTCNVTSPVTVGETIWTCTGWTGTGSVPASGGSLSVTFSITMNSSITWNWQGTPVQYELHVEVSGSGITNATGTAIYNASTVVHVLATPSAGWTLNKWLLNGSDSGSANPYTLTMTANYKLTATFTPEDFVPLSGWVVDSSLTNAPYTLNSTESNLSLELAAVNTNSRVTVYSLSVPSLDLGGFDHIDVAVTGTSNARILLRFFMDNGAGFDVVYWSNPTTLDAISFDLGAYAGRKLTIVYVALMSSDGLTASIDITGITFVATAPLPVVPLSGWTVDPFLTNAAYTLNSTETSLSLELTAVNTSSRVTIYTLGVPTLNLGDYDHIDVAVTGTANARILMRFFMDNDAGFDVVYWADPATLNAISFDLSAYSGRTLTIAYIALMSSDGLTANVDITDIALVATAPPPVVPLAAWVVDSSLTNSLYTLSSTESILSLGLDAVDTASRVTIYSLAVPSADLGGFDHIDVAVTGTSNARVLLRFFMDNGAGFDVVYWSDAATLDAISFDLSAYAGRTLTVAYIALMSSDGLDASIDITQIALAA